MNKYEKIFKKHMFFDTNDYKHREILRQLTDTKNLEEALLIFKKAKWFIGEILLNKIKADDKDFKEIDKKYIEQQDAKTKSIIEEATFAQQLTNQKNNKARVGKGASIDMNRMNELTDVN